MNYCGPRGIPLHAFLEWPQESQDAALAWAAHEARRCPGCRTHRDDWADRAEPVHWHDEVCPGCQHKANAVKQLQNDADGTKGVVLVCAHGSRKECEICSVA